MLRAHCQQLNSLPSHPCTSFIDLSSDLSSTSPHFSSPTNHLSLFHLPGYESCLSPHLLFLTLCVCLCVIHIQLGHPMCMNGPECGSLYMCSSLVHFLYVCVNMYLDMSVGVLLKASFTATLVSFCKRSHV